MPVQPTGQCDQGKLHGFRPGRHPDRKGPLGSCTHRYDTNFAALVLAGCDRTKHIGNLTPRWIGTHHQQDPGTGIYQQEYERQEAARLA